MFRSNNLTLGGGTLARYCRGAFINGPVRMCAALLYWGLIGFVIALCFVPGVTKLELLAALVAMKVARAATTLNPAPTLTLALAHGSSPPALRTPLHPLAGRVGCQPRRRLRLPG